MPERPYPSEAYLLAFQKLRKHVHKTMQDRLNARLDAGNWQPTDFELEIDAYEEEIEPQVLGAVKTLNQKGYTTASSGFYGTYAEYQAIDGPFTVSRRARQGLAQIGVAVEPLIISGTQLQGCSLIKFHLSGP